MRFLRLCTWIRLFAGACGLGLAAVAVAAAAGGVDVLADPVGYATTAYELHASRPVKEIVLAPEVSAWRFDREDGRTVIALYAKQNGDRNLILDAAPASTRVVNFFGRTVSTGDRVEIPLSRNPVFVSTETNDVAFLERADQ